MLGENLDENADPEKLDRPQATKQADCDYFLADAGVSDFPRCFDESVNNEYRVDVSSGRLHHSSEE